MGKKQVRHSAELQATVALESLKGLKMVNELASQNQVHPTQISQWKRQIQGGATDLFANGRGMGTQMRSQEHSEFRQTLQQIKRYIIKHTT